MKNKIKGLLALVLSVLIGQVWAATPVATWTDFNTLTSGNYTLMADMSTEEGDGKCKVNPDGSITLGGAGLELSFSAGQPAYDNNSITVVMDVSNVPSDAKLVDVTTHGQSDNLYYGTDGKLYQREGTTANYGNCAWTAERATIAFAYGAGGGNTTGTTTYINGVKSIDADNLKWTGSGRYVTKVAFPATGMTIHSIRVYGTKLSAAEVPVSVPMAAFGVNFMYGTGQELTVGGFEKGLHTAPAKWLNVSGSANGSGTVTVGQDQYAVAWTAHKGAYKSDCSTDTAAGKLLYGYLDDCINSGRVKATVTITGLPTDKKYAAALILSGDGANNTDANGKFSPALINGETYSYVNGALVTGDTAKAATTWGDRSKAAAAAGLAEGTNVMFVEGLTGDTLTITSALDAWNVSRLTIAGVQVWIMGDTVLTVPAEGLTYTEDMAINYEVSGTGTLTADNCTLDVTEATMNGCSLAAQNNGVIVLKSDQLDTIGGLTIPQGATVKIITDAIDAVIAGEATFAMPENTTIAGTVTLVTLDGEKEATAEIADGILTAKFIANPTITGPNWWWDYEFNGSDASIGSDTGTMSLEGSATSYTEADANGNQELYFQKTPYRGASFASQDAFTAVMYCQPGNYNNVPLVGFGTLSGTAVILATGDNAANGEMQILLNRGNSLTSLADNLIVPNATTAKHLYAFTYDVQADKTVISVYVDGKLKKVTTINEQLLVSNGFQIGSVHGGVCTGLTKYPASGDAGTIDFLRVAKGVLSAETMTALAKAYPYVSEKGIAQRTITDATATWVADASWTQKVPNADDATQAAPNEGTMVELTTTSDTQVSVSLNLEADASYETLTIAGSDVKLVAGEYGKKIVAGDVTIDANVTIPYGVVEIGTLTVNTGKALTFDFSAYDFASVWADRTISLTGLATVADGAEVTATIPETLPVQIQSATLAYNGETQEYALVIEVVEGELTGTIAADGNWDSITWKKGEITVTPSDFAAMESVNLTVSADATLTMNKAVTVKNLVIFGDGALIIAENGGNKLTVSGATTINANVTATAGAAALGSITINEDKSLTIKESIANVGRITSNAGELVYMGGGIGINEGVQLNNAIGAIRIATGTVNFTNANGDYRSGAITIDNGATMKVSGGQHNSFGNSPITNNGAIVSTGSGAHLYPVVSGSGTLTVESGTLTLHGANTYEGGTTVAGGTLVVSGANATTKVLPEGKTVTVNANATIQLVAGLSFVTIEGEGKTLVSGTYTYGISNTFQNTLATKTVEVAEDGVLQFRAWKVYALTIDSLIVNGTLKSEGWNGTTVPTVTVAQNQNLSGAGTIEIPVTLADGATLAGAVTVNNTVTIDGTVTITHAKNAGDVVITCNNAADIVASLPTAPQGLKYVAENGAVKLAVDVAVVKPGAPITGLTAEAADAVVVQTTAPEGVDQEIYAGYFKKTVTPEEDGTYTVSAVLDAEVVTPTIAGTTEGDTAKEAFVVNADGSVALNIANRKAGLHYAVQVKSAIDGDVYAVVPETNDGLVVSAEKIPSGGTAFFRVIVDFETIDAVEPDTSENDGEDGGSAEAEPMPEPMPDDAE